MGREGCALTTVAESSVLDQAGYPVSLPTAHVAAEVAYFGRVSAVLMVRGGGGSELAMP